MADVAVPAPAAAPQWTRGTEVELMVTKEVNSRSSKAGDLVKLRVNAPVVINGQIAISVGASAWAEVISVAGTSAAGGSGRLSMRLLYLETAWGRVELSGTQGAEGASNTGGVVMSVLGFGLLGLLHKGSNATFKAGDIIRGYISAGEDPASATAMQVSVPAQPAPPAAATDMSSASPSSVMARTAVVQPPPVAPAK